jgi:DnaK suppressor protein
MEDGQSLDHLCRPDPTLRDVSKDIECGLRTRRAELTADLERLTEPPEEGASVAFGKRVGDGTTEAVERLATTATARSLAASIADIDHALEKLEEGTYGICDGCGEPIPKARLEALPAIASCVGCASAG